MSAQRDAIRRQLGFDLIEAAGPDVSYERPKVSAPTQEEIEDGVYYANPGETVHGVKNITHRKLAITVISGQVVSVTPAD